jgi:transcriptional regulator with GAF, ATPase, and Fis domain
MVRQLVQHRYTTNLRELRSLLWRAIMRSDPSVEMDVSAEATAPEAPAPSPSPSPPSEPVRARPGGRPDAPTREQVQRSLDENNGSIEQAWRALGLSSRFALLRLIKRYDIEVRRRPARLPR